MSYRLEDGEAVRDGIRRCAREELDNAVEELTDGISDDPVEAIHDARKSLKKARSLLRLARAAFVPDERRREAAVLREAGHRLSEARDADVMVSALEELAERFSGMAPQRTFAAARTRLVAERKIERVRSLESAAAAAVAIDLQAIRRELDDATLRCGGWRALAEGLLRSYRRGRTAFTLARAEPTPEHLHDWRKRVKDLWYHLRLLKPISESTMRGHADEAHRLSELLGDDHDLWVLRPADRRARPAPNRAADRGHAAGRTRLRGEAESVSAPHPSLLEGVARGIKRRPVWRLADRRQRRRVTPRGPKPAALRIAWNRTANRAPYDRIKASRQNPGLGSRRCGATRPSVPPG
jgi:CHAD domain-containing protein